MRMTGQVGRVWGLRERERERRRETEKERKRRHQKREGRGNYCAASEPRLLRPGAETAD